MKKKDVIKALSGSITSGDLINMLNCASDVYELLGEDFNIDNDDMKEVIDSLATINILANALASKLKIEKEVNEAEECLILNIISANCTGNEIELDNGYDFYDDDYDDEFSEDFDDTGDFESENDFDDIDTEDFDDTGDFESENDFDDIDTEDFDDTDEEDSDTEEDFKNLDDIFGKYKDSSDDRGSFIVEDEGHSDDKEDSSNEYRINTSEAFLSAFDVFNQSDEMN